MPDHVRHQIRDDIKTTITGLTTTGTKVFSARTTALTASTDYPALLIDSFSEQTVADTMGSSRGLMRVMELKILAVEEHGAGFEDTLDTIAKEVEEAIAADPTLGGLAKDARLTESDMMIKLDQDHHQDRELLAVGTQNVGILTMIWTITYRTAEDAVTTAL